jgi:hypothetical protein
MDARKLTLWRVIIRSKMIIWSIEHTQRMMEAVLSDQMDTNENEMAADSRYIFVRMGMQE